MGRRPKTTVTYRVLFRWVDFVYLPKLVVLVALVKIDKNNNKTNLLLFYEWIVLQK